MSHYRARLFLLALSPAALGLAACSSGSSDDADKQAAIAAVTAKLSEDDGGISGGVSDEQELCVAKGMVEKLGATRVLEVAKLDDLVLTNAEATKTADVFLRCVDVAAIMAEGMTEDGEISKKSAKCLADKIDPKDIRGALIASFEGKETSGDDLPPQVLTAVIAALPTCLSAEELKSIGR